MRQRPVSSVVVGFVVMACGEALGEGVKSFGGVYATPMVQPRLHMDWFCFFWRDGDVSRVVLRCSLGCAAAQALC